MRRSLTKPVLIDFKGHACANCKQMDARVWSDPEVQRRIRENFVLVGLYVDDRTKLPDNEVFVSKIDGKEKKTMGKKNEDIEISMFNTNTLPLYAIVDPSGKAPDRKPGAPTLTFRYTSTGLDRGAGRLSQGKKSELEPGDLDLESPIGHGESRLLPMVRLWSC
ncbi:MAG: thioredoxin family protein [Sphingobacterium sp.]|nr:thioredoxin family protein [Sphingobacterium sp.]